jgi:hypothetical protein
MSLGGFAGFNTLQYIYFYAGIHFTKGLVLCHNRFSNDADKGGIFNKIHLRHGNIGAFNN